MTSIETLASRISEGAATRQELVEVLLDTELMMPSATNPKTDGVQPVMTEIEDIPHLVVATGEEGLRQTARIANWAFLVKGREVLARMSKGHGILVNTSEGAVAIHPATLDIVRERHGITGPGLR